MTWCSPGEGTGIPAEPKRQAQIQCLPHKPVGKKKYGNIYGNDLEFTLTYQEVNH